MAYGEELRYGACRNHGTGKRNIKMFLVPKERKEIIKKCLQKRRRKIIV